MHHPFRRPAGPHGVRGANQRTSLVPATVLALSAVSAAAIFAGPARPARADGPTPAVCYYHGSAPALSNGAPDTCEMDSSGNVRVSASLAQYPAAGVADGMSNPITTQTGANVLLVAPANGQWYRWGNAQGTVTTGANGINAGTVVPYNWNGATYDQAFNNLAATLISSGAYTATQTSSDQTNFNGRGTKCAVDVSSAGSGSITPEIDGKDQVSGVYYPLLTGAALTTNGLTTLTIYPGITAAANSAASDVLPRSWRLRVSANNASPVSYSVGCTTIL